MHWRPVNIASISAAKRFKRGSSIDHLSSLGWSGQTPFEVEGDEKIVEIIEYPP